jgi:hypothetical protein
MRECATAVLKAGSKEPSTAASSEFGRDDRKVDRKAVLRVYAKDLMTVDEMVGRMVDLR